MFYETYEKCGVMYYHSGTKTRGLGKCRTESYSEKQCPRKTRSDPKGQSRKQPWAEAMHELFPGAASVEALYALRPRVPVARVPAVVMAAGAGNAVSRHLNKKMLQVWGMEERGWKRGRD